MSSFSVSPLSSFSGSLSPISSTQANSGGTQFSSYFQSANEPSGSSESTASENDTTATAPSRSSRPKSTDKPDDKRDHTAAAASGNDSAALLGTQVPQQLLLDDRKLQISLNKPTTAAAPQAATSAAATASSGSAALKDKVNNAGTNKGGIAFGANLHVNAAGVSDSTKTVTDAKGSGKKEQDSDSGSGDSQPEKKGTVAPATASNVSMSSLVHTAPETTQTSVAPAATGHVQEAYSANAASKPVEAAPVASTAPVLDPPATASTSNNKTIDFEVASAGNDAVNVRVSQRAGDMQVTVRTPDGELAQSLRQHLPELSDRLAQSGVQGDLWQPSTSSATNDQSSDSNSSDTSQQGQAAYSDGQSNQKQQEKNQSAWLKQIYDAEPTH